MLKSWFNKKPISSSPQQQALQHLQLKIKQAIESWQKNLDKRERNAVSGSPWFLVVGSANSGKTTLLAKSELDLRSSHSNQVDCSKPTRSPEFWTYGHHLFVDIPGDWYASQEGSTDEQRFHHLLKLIPRYRNPKAATTVLQVIDIHRVTCHDSPDKDQEFALISKQLQFLHDWNNRIDIYLTFNQADSIPGFTAFFAQLSQDERKQLLGIGLNFDDGKPLFDSLHAQLNAFYNQLSAQTIKRLHQERSQVTRDLITDFPFQVKSLLARINQLLENLPEPVLRRVKGIHFTSCRQEPSSTQSAPANENSMQLFSHQSMNHVYFVEDLFLSLLAQSEQQPPRWRPAYTHGLIAAAAISVGLCAVHSGFQHSQQQLTQLNESLQQEQLKPISAAPPWLNQLIRLQYLEQKIQVDGKMKTALVNLLTSRSTSPQHHATYQNLLQMQFKPFILNQISTALATDIQTHSPQLLSALTAYYSLTQSQPNVELIVAWFEQDWYQHYPNHATEIELLSMSLRNLLQNSGHFTADTQLMQQARTLIATTPIEQLVFSLLKNQPSAATDTAALSQPESLKQPLLQQNTFFDPNTVSEKLNQQIPNLVNYLMTQTWILGRPLIQPEQKAVVIETVKQHYLTDLSHVWKTAFERINLAQSQQLSSDADLANYLGNLDSPLWQKLGQISELLLSHGISGDDKAYWQTVQNALSDENNQTLTQAALKETAIYLRRAAEDTTGKGAFTASQKRMRTNPASNPLQILLTLANIVPSPMSNWLQQLSQQSWRHLLQDSLSYVNTQWKTSLYSDYENRIDGKYPFFKNSQADVSAEDFNQFFGLDGSIQKFYEYYLSDFVNLKQSNWSLKTVAGEKLALNHAVMNSVVQASLIQRMFYKNQKATPSSRFSIKPAHLSKKIKKVTLEVNGKATDFSLMNFKPFTQSWPGTDKSSATLQCTSMGNAHVTLHYDGPWAWLRLLDHAHISHSKKGTYFNVMFDFNHHQAKFKLAADNAINPYASDILDHFRLPKGVAVSSKP